ncbi:MAG: MFS transporter, partial [Bacteroidales bacterium]|nr:MFS transporter [Bacteroidales bacterium]
MTLSSKDSRNNYLSFLWHGLFLALAQNFMDVDTILPAMLLEAGGGAVHIGILTTIMLGGSSVTQLIFAPYITNHSYKKKFLLLGINSRILALIGLSALLWFSQRIQESYILLLIFVLITLFSLGGAFANVSFTDIFGKSVFDSQRKSFFSIRQAIVGAGVFVSAFFARIVLISTDYPSNFSLMFLIGFISLTLASLGFWNIKETVPSQLPIKGFKNFLEYFKTELKRNPRLKYFLGFVNTQGIVITMMPFLLLYSKEVLHTSTGQTGVYLIYKVIGTIITGLTIFFLKEKIKYGLMLKGNVLIALLTPLIIIFAGDYIPLEPFFLVGG